MTDIQERLEHYEAKDRERQEREAEIVRLDLQLFVYARNHDTPGDDYYRKYVQRNAMILDYGKTYGTEAQKRLREMLDEAHEKFLARAQELEETAGIKDTDEVGELRKQVRPYNSEVLRYYLRYYRDKLTEARDEAATLIYALDTFIKRHPEYAEEIYTLIDISENDLEDDDD